MGTAHCSSWPILGFITNLPSTPVSVPRRGMCLSTCSKAFHTLMIMFSRSVPGNGITGSKCMMNFTAFEIYCQIALQKSYSFHFLELLLSLSIILKKTCSNLIGKTMLFLCTNVSLIGFPRGPTDIYLDASSPPPDFCTDISEFHGTVEDWVSNQVWSVCLVRFNPPLNPNLSYSVGGISSPMFMVF